MEIEDIVAFYITATNGRYLQLTAYPGQVHLLHEETPHLQKFVGVGKNYPFLHNTNEVAWNGRIFYSLTPTPSPTRAPIITSPSTPQTNTEENTNFFYCGINRQDAIQCASPCPSGSNSECPGSQKWYVT